MDGKRWIPLLAAMAAGAVNGIFGGGGGMVLLPLLGREKSLRGNALFACSLAVMLPLSVVSLSVSALSAPLPLAEALPYLVGGALGAVVGGKTFCRVNVRWLRLLFAAFLCYAGARYLL